ncbi:MAG: hypothetical protein ACREVS_22770 [Burkholderiales bacterium]
MDLTRFRACAEAHGADRRRWPAREHALYDRFAATPEGVAILAEAERTDRFLDGFEVAESDQALAEAISNRPSRGRGAGGVVRRRFWLPAAAFAASAILGFVIGFAQVRDDGSGDLVTQLLLGPTSVREIGL